MKKRLPFILVGIAIFVVVAVLITQVAIRKITEREIKRITEQQVGKATDAVTQQEIERITQQEIDRITKEKTKEILGNLGFGGEKALQPCAIAPTKRQFSNTPYYTGSLFDSHVHMPVSSKIVSDISIQSGFRDMPAFDEDLSIDYIVCLFDSEGITKTIGFFLAPSPVFAQTISMVENIEERHPGKIIAFYMPTPLSSVNPESSTVEETITENPDLFQGIGEVKFAFTEIANAEPEDQDYLELYTIAGKHNLIVMMHPAADHKDELERLLTKYPNVIFFIHGDEVESWIFDLMNTHDNLYFQIGHNLYIYGHLEEHVSRAVTKEEWLAYFKPKFNAVLDAEVKKWKPIIAAHPDKLTLGTDRWYRWHFDQDAGALMEEFERSFLGQFDPVTQEKLAYKNAERMLEGR